VYFARYWDWYEECFERYITKASGRSWRDLLDSGIAMPLVHCEIDYLAPARLSDTVDATLALVAVGTSSIRFMIEFSTGGEIAARASCVHVAVGDGLLPIDVPQWLRDTLDDPLVP
jgi:acyl-CoA thioesterase FadM